MTRKAVGASVVLAVETSCDETSVAVWAGGALKASEVASQATLHEAYGGVVPEVASRNHLRLLRPTLERALDRAGLSLEAVDAFAATHGPGLATSLMVGASMAKGMAVALGKPFLAINHVEGHLLSPFLGDPEGPQPSIALVVSGGHTLLVRVHGVGRYEVLGKTLDDAAGEAFDKVGKLLGLPYPGGPQVNRLACAGDARRWDFPRSMLASGGYDFSFSGLKTAVRYFLEKETGYRLEDVCASFQEAVVEVLVRKTMRALEATGLGVLSVSGGVSCNSRLRERFEQECGRAGVRLLLAPASLCTDNAGMIAYVAALRLRDGTRSELESEIEPNLNLGRWRSVLAGEHGVGEGAQ
jgi:N6-L-threonylcarbamoyladenine synthase